MPKKSNKESNELTIIKLILELISLYLGACAIIFLKGWYTKLKKISIQDLKLIYIFFLLFDDDHESIDWKKLLIVKEEMVCIIISNITTLYIHKDRLVKISTYFNTILTGPFKINYCKLNNLYFIDIKNNGNFQDKTIKIWSKIIEKQAFFNGSDIDNKQDFIDCYYFLGIDLKQLTISDYYMKKIFGDNN